MTPERLRQILRNAGCTRLLAKRLSPNDNSKNQIYLGGSFATLNLLPFGKLMEDASNVASSKRARLKAKVFFSWIDEAARPEEAPGANLILYPKYPEVRLSGLLAGVRSRHPGSVVAKRTEGRWLLLGITAAASIIAYACEPDSECGKWAEAVAAKGSIHGVLHEFPLFGDSGDGGIRTELLRIAQRGWIRSKRLDAHGATLPCESENCGGYTLEAELGIRPNGRADPDFHGWEVKQFAVRDLAIPSGGPVTIFTPEPDGGLYRTRGFEPFLKKFGYPSLSGIEGRFDFGGVHRVGEIHPRTGLTLALDGWDGATSTIRDLGGGIRLIDERGELAASWSFTALINHWKRKHSQAVYVPSTMRPAPRAYRYGSSVFACTGADFPLVLTAFAQGAVYYDPGMKLETGPDGARSKRRSQFRVHFKHLGRLYRDARWWQLESEAVPGKPDV